RVDEAGAQPLRRIASYATRISNMSVGLWLRGWRDLARHYASVAGVAWRDREALEGKRYEAEEAEFLPAALALQQTPISPVPRVLMGLLTTFIVLALLWSILG